MRLFSQRKGIVPVKNVMQVDTIDTDLRNKLWDALTIFYWKKVKAVWISQFHIYADSQKIVVLLQRLWHDYYKQPIDTIDDHWPTTYGVIRKYFFNCEWNEVYDFIEFIANSYPDNSENLKFMEFCNSILEGELSAYRFVGGKIAQITTENEIVEIEEALGVPDSLKLVKIHLQRALDLLTDRKSPDYRNSIKESISAVEAICKLIANNDKATLGEALNAIGKEKKVKMHPALGGAFNKLYGYTNDAEGIRHALLDESNLDFEDSKFMLVSCSGFINYLISKSSKAGIKL